MSSPSNNASAQWLDRFMTVLREDVQAIRPRQHVFSLLSRAIPIQVGSELRAKLLRLRGFQIGEGTRVFDTPSITMGAERDTRNLRVGRDCVIDVGCLFELGAELTIGDRVTLGHQVVILTTTHQLGMREHRAGDLVHRPVVIGDGAWIGCRCIVLPGVTVGAGAIVEPGTVLNKEVAPHTRVGGTPMKKLEDLTP